MRHFTIHHDDVTIAVSRGGRGRPLVLCPGLNSTQAELHELTELLRYDHNVVTFDLRGHGLSTASDRYSFDAFLSDLVAVMAEFLAMWKALATQQETMRGTTRQVLLTAQEILDLNVEIDVVRSGILDRYRKIDRPISIVMSTSMAGDSGEEHALRLNQNWRAGVERLVREQPHIAPFWLDADHRLAFTHAPEIAQIIRGAQGAGEEPTR